jgi:hypothetical protein
MLNLLWIALVPALEFAEKTAPGLRWLTCVAGVGTALWGVSLPAAGRGELAFPG